MPSKALATYETIQKPTITLASLANGAGRISAVIDNTTVRAPAALVYLKVTTGGVAPTANTPVKLYLIRRSNDGTTDLSDGGLGTSDAAVSAEPTNAEQVGSIIVSAATNTTYIKAFPVYDLSSEYSFVVWNATGQALNATAGNFEPQVAPALAAAGSVGLVDAAQLRTILALAGQALAKKPVVYPALAPYTAAQVQAMVEQLVALTTAVLATYTAIIPAADLERLLGAVAERLVDA